MKRATLLLCLLITAYAASTDWLTDSAPGWMKVTHASGAGRRTTETFHVPSGSWQVKWKFAPKTIRSPGPFYIAAQGAATLMVASGDKLEGTKQFNTPGKFALSISGDDYVWVVVVERQQKK